MGRRFVNMVVVANLGKCVGVGTCSCAQIGAHLRFFFLFYVAPRWQSTLPEACAELERDDDADDDEDDEDDADDDDEDDDDDDDDDETTTTVAYERRLRDAVLQAAGGGDLTWDQARDGLRVVSVGIFSKTDRRACACGQSPLQQVFHLRHEATGKPLDIGFSCAKRFRMLGDAACFLLLAARCLLPLQLFVCEIAEEVKPEMKFQSQAILAFCSLLPAPPACCLLPAACCLLPAACCLLRPHQHKQMDFLRSRRDALVNSACGSGKTFVQLPECRAELAIVVLPWLALADQFLNDNSENDRCPALQEYQVREVSSGRKGTKHTILRGSAEEEQEEG